LNSIFTANTGLARADSEHVGGSSVTTFAARGGRGARALTGAGERHARDSAIAAIAQHGIQAVRSDALRCGHRALAQQLVLQSCTAQTSNGRGAGPPNTNNMKQPRQISRMIGAKRLGRACTRATQNNGQKACTPHSLSGERCETAHPRNEEPTPSMITTMHAAMTTARGGGAARSGSHAKMAQPL
jgi:hypothetical protein